LLEKKGEGIRGREKQKRENCEGIIFQERKNGARERGKSTGKSEEKMLSRGSKKREKRAQGFFSLLFCKLSLLLCFQFYFQLHFFFFVFVLAMVFGLFCVRKYQLILWIDDCLLLLLLLLL